MAIDFGQTFKARFLGDPKGALLTDMGMEIPEEIKLSVLELSATERKDFKPEEGIEYIILNSQMASAAELS